MMNLTNRLLHLQWKRICIWRSNTDEIKLMKRLIQESTRDGCKCSGLRRTIQLNGVRRWDLWCEKDPQKLIAALKTTNPTWICKEFEKYETRKGRGSSLQRRRPQNARSTFSIVTWNVQGINNKIRLITTKIEEDAPTIAILQETRLQFARSIHSPHYSCTSVPEAKGEESARGIAILFRKDAIEAKQLNINQGTERWTIVTEIKEKATNAKWILVGIYLNSDTSTRQKHIPRLAGVLDAVKEQYPNHEIIVAGDWNMKAHDVDATLNTYGHLGLTRMGNWCANEYTWRKVEGGKITKRTLIDHFAATANVNASISIDNTVELSDHSPVTIKWTRQDANNSEPQITRRMDHKLLLDKGDKIRSSNYFQPLLEIEDMESLAKALSESSWKVAEEENCIRTSSQSQHAKRPRIGNKTKATLKRRAEAVTKWLENPTEENMKEVQEEMANAKTLLKEDARRRRENYQTRMVDPLIVGDDPAEAYRRINQAAGRARTRVEVTEMLDKDTGVIHTTEENMHRILTNHYVQLFKDSDKNEEIDWKARIAHRYDTELPHINHPITWLEICTALRKMGRNKSPGPDGVVSELYITCTHAKTAEEKEAIKHAPICNLGRAIHHVITKCWEQEYFPREWDAATIISIPKKPGANDPNLFRGISLIQTISKLMTSILAQRIQGAAIEAGRIATEQAGFRAGEEAIAQAITVAEVIQRTQATKNRAIITFLDAEKAFDRAPHGAILAKIEAFGVRGKTLNIIKSLYRSPSFKVKFRNTMSEEHRVEKGVKQGESLSPILFLIYINDFIQAMQNGPSAGLKLSNQLQPILAAKFADDIAMIAPDIETAQYQLDRASLWMDTWKMNANANKCAVMICEPRQQQRQGAQSAVSSDFKIQGKQIEVRTEYLYLGIQLNNKMDKKAMAKHRLDKARSIKNLCLPFLHSNATPFLAKLIILKQVIIPTMTYGIEIWGWNDAAAEEMDQLVAHCMRAVLGATRTSQAQLMRDMLGIENARTTTGKRCLRLLHKSATSNTHFQDISTIDDEVLIGWTRSTRKFLNRINFDKFNRKPSDDARGAKRSKTFNTANLEEDWPIFQKHLNQRAEALQEHANRKNVKQLESVERYYKQKTYRWNQHLLQALKDLPTLTAGLTTIMRIRMNDWVGAYRLSRYKWYPSEWRDKCPLCGAERRESIEHYLVNCETWSQERWETMKIVNPTLTQVRWIALITGREAIEIWKAAYPHSIITEDASAVIEPKGTEHNKDTETAKRWIKNIATFIQQTKWKRWKRLSSAKLNTKDHSVDTLRQSKIEEYFTKL